MRTRDWIALATFGLFVGPAAILIYASWYGGSVIGDGIYSVVKALSGADDTTFAKYLVRAGRFLTVWWWFMAMASLAITTLLATCLAATEPGASIGSKALWVLSFFLLVVTVPIYCIWQMGSRPNQSFKPTPSARLN